MTTDPKHFEGCWQMHPACALVRIRELEAEVGRLKLDILTRDAQAMGMYDTQSGPIFTGVNEAGQPFPIPIHFVPCADVTTHDHIEPPINSHGPTWAAHHDDPPSVTP